MITKSVPMQQVVASTATLVDRLVDAFNREEVVYSHWKSNIDLAQATAGETDLDLLVDRKSLSHALTILSDLGFKPAVARSGVNPPSIRHYYGFDPDTTQLIHVHLFSRVLTGESYVKSHLFPFEAMLLENVYYSNHIRVTSKPAELVLFTLRTFVKYGSLLDLLALRRKSDSINREVCWLLNGSDLAEALSLLRRYCPVIDERLFIECVGVLKKDGPLSKRIMLAQQVRRRLKVYAKYTFFGRPLAYGQVLWAEVRRRWGTKQKNKVPQAGGAVVAFVGPEATGKSTLVAESRDWLGSVFAVRTVHAGKPPSTWLTWPLNVGLPLLRELVPQLRTSRLERHVAPKKPHQAPREIKGATSLMYALRAVSLAWDRRHLLVRVRRAAANGEIVICDRYPSDTIGTMDSPRLREQPNERGIVAGVFNWLARLERQLYRQIPPPDLVLRLNVSIKTAQQRNRDRIKPGKEPDAYVESRHRHSREWQRSGTKYIHDIDTEQSLKDTILCVKKAIWETL